MLLSKSFKNLQDAVFECYKNSKAGDLVLLAPGCSSTDQYENFEERGRIFKKAVLEVLFMKAGVKKAKRILSGTYKEPD